MWIRVRPIDDDDYYYPSVKQKSSTTELPSTCMEKAPRLRNSYAAKYT